MAAGRFLVRDGSEDRLVELDGQCHVTQNGSDRRLTVTALDSVSCEVSDGQRVRRVYVAGPPEAREVFVDGRVFRFEVVPAGQRSRKPAAAHADTMTAPMPGTVIKVLAEPGQQVRRGDILIKLEAMKMELPIRAPHDGAVKAIHCREGDLVQAGVRLLDLS